VKETKVSDFLDVTVISMATNPYSGT